MASLGRLLTDHSHARSGPIGTRIGEALDAALSLRDIDLRRARSRRDLEHLVSLDDRKALLSLTSDF